MDLETVLERMQPYDVNSPSKKTFLNCLNEFPQLKESLRFQLTSEENSEWIKKAKEGEIYFIINDDRWKNKKIFIKTSPTIVLSLISREEVPTISINI